jgi:hypothetical protein
MLPSSVAEIGLAYSRIIANEVDEALALLGQAQRRGYRSPDAWRDAVQSIGDRLLSQQVFIASIADAYLNDVLDAQGSSLDTEAQVNPVAFADVADGGGSWLQSLVFAANSVRAPGVDWRIQFDFIAQSIVKGGLNDTGRASVQTGMQGRPSCEYYVRMLVGKSCARCAILASRKYRSSVAFRRHRRCDCRNIPGPEDIDDWSTDVDEYFTSLSTEDQNEVFGKAAAEAIRLGANPAQVVNAKSGVYVARAYGEEVLATTTGITVRGAAGKRLESGGTTTLPGQRYRSATTPRPLPDEIFLQAERLGWDREEILRQLKHFAYVL